MESWGHGRAGQGLATQLSFPSWGSHKHLTLTTHPYPVPSPNPPKLTILGHPG